MAAPISEMMPQQLQIQVFVYSRNMRDGEIMFLSEMGAVKAKSSLESKIAKLIGDNFTKIENLHLAHPKGRG